MKQYSYEKAIEKAKQHNLIHQYTTFCALDKIINNKSLQLTRIDLLNDFVENNRMSDPWKKKVFVSCFTNRKHESYFFWKTYAKGDSSGVMISFDPQTLCSLSIHPDATCKEEQLSFCNRSMLEIPFSDAISSKSWGIHSFCLVDVMYIPRNQNITNIDYHQGRFKYVEWDAEEETRLRVSIRPKCSEFILEGIETTYLTPSTECIYAKLTDSCLEKMIITLSPFADENLLHKVENLLRENNLIDKIQIRSSTLTEEISASSPPDMQTP